MGDPSVGGTLRLIAFNLSQNKEREAHKGSAIVLIVHTLPFPNQLFCEEPSATPRCGSENLWQNEVMASARLAITLIAGMSLGLVVHRQSEKTSTQVEIDAGLIDGTVFYENGTPVKGATVKAVPLGRPLAAIIPHADTDETGHFGIRISRSWFGECAVAAQKEDEDYPDMSQQFYSDGKFQTVTLTSSHPSASVTLRLGPKAGVLVGTVNDALTGAPLSPCVEIRRISEPNNFLSGSGLVKPSYKLLIPPETGIYMRIWLDGYKSWYFPGTTKESASQAVKLKPGERMTVNILLQPDAERAGTGCPKPIEVLHSR